MGIERQRNGVESDLEADFNNAAGYVLDATTVFESIRSTLPEEEQRRFDDILKTAQERISTVHAKYL